MNVLPRRYAFVFVCQSGELEIKALLLAASLRRNLRCEYELIAAVPTPASIWGELAPQTRALLEQLGVRIEAIVNPLAADYPIGNKLACLAVPTDADKIVFLDSDILCLRDFGQPDCLEVAFAAKPADLRTFAAAVEAWQPLYAAAGVALPSLRLPTTVSGEFGLAYFNSGVIFADAWAGMGRAWIACARAIENVPAMREQRHWLDQVSLAIAVHERGLAYSGLDERFNFPAHLRPLPGELPFLCHYHWPRIIAREPILVDFVRDLAQSYAYLAQRMRSEAAWSALLDAPPRSSDAHEPAGTTSAAHYIVLGGIPDSGADVLLGQLRNSGAHVLDEPEDLRPGLEAAQTPLEIALRLSDLRRSRLAADSATIHPLSVASHATVVLKSALGVLCRLDALRRVLPHAKFIVCVRNPFDTIAAWKARPAAELDAQIESAGAFADAWLARVERDGLRRIAGLPNVAEKRAAWWWWLAQRVLAQAHAVTLVRFGELATNPAGIIAGLLPAEALGTDVTHAPVAGATTMHSGSGLLDDEDLQAIRAICLQAAAELGVSERGS